MPRHRAVRGEIPVVPTIRRGPAVRRGGSTAPIVGIGGPTTGRAHLAYLYQPESI
jgi:hypothetical protein